VFAWPDRIWVLAEPPAEYVECESERDIGRCFTTNCVSGKRLIVISAGAVELLPEFLDIVDFVPLELRLDLPIGPV